MALVERPRVVVLLSGAGSTAEAVFAAAADPAYPDVVGVVSDRADAAGLVRAADHGIATTVLAPDGFPNRADWNAALGDSVAGFAPNLVLSAGFMRILDAAFVTRFAPRLINSHPALLPAFPGAHGVRDALAYGVRVTGATVHVVDAGVDTGPIVEQRCVEVLDDDDEASLHERIKAVERTMLVDVVAALAGARIELDGRKVRVW
jgi:phosphoribosylglycinamide formyltransferase-1